MERKSEAVAETRERRRFSREIGVNEENVWFTDGWENVKKVPKSMKGMPTNE